VRFGTARPPLKRGGARRERENKADDNQNTNVAVVPGQQVFTAVLDLSSWANAVSGSQWYVRRDAWYARLV
jgi:hypothetical protein